jgi:hypothetical protein
MVEALSRLVHGHRRSLELVAYLPNRTKGGVLVRPRYWRHSGAAAAARTRFDALASLSIRLEVRVVGADGGEQAREEWGTNTSGDEQAREGWGMNTGGNERAIERVMRVGMLPSRRVGVGGARSRVSAAIE